MWLFGLQRLCVSSSTDPTQRYCHRISFAVQAHAAQLKERSLALQQLRKTKEEKRQKRSGLSEPAASSAEPPQQDVSGDMGPQRSLFKHRAPQRQHHTINTRKRWPPGQAQQSSEQPAVDDSHVSRRRTHAPLRHRETVSDRTARAFPDSLRSTPSSLPPLVMGPEEVSTTGRAGQGTQPQHRLQAAQAAPAAAPGNVYAELQQDRRSARQSGDAPDQLDWDPPGVVQEQQASSLPDLELPVPIRYHALEPQTVLRGSRAGSTCPAGQLRWSSSSRC